MTNRRLFLSILLLLLLPTIAAGAILPRDRIKNGGYILFSGGRIIEQYRAEEMFVPASTIKLLTTQVALRILGPNYRFTTSFFLDASGVLYVRGGGDPTLTTESLARAAQELQHRGVKRISAYVLDDSAFQLEQELPDGSENSLNPYDTANSALAVNFNSIALLKRQNGTITSAEELTPLTAVGEEIGRMLPPGRQRVNIQALPLRGSLPPSLRYSAELLHAMLTKEGIAAQPVFRRGPVSRKARLIYRHNSPEPLEEIIRNCLKVSNNFVANQLILTAAAVRYGYPATWEKARNLLNLYAVRTLGISSRELQITEGSGLSRQTRITPAAMLRILRAFEPYRELLPIKEGAQLKSGTMKDVFCYAGYLDSGHGPVLFVLLLNQAENSRKMLLASLEKHFASAGTENSRTGLSGRQ